MEKGICGSPSETNKKANCNLKTGIGISNQNGVDAREITIPMDRAILDNRQQEWYVSIGYPSRGESTEMDQWFPA